MAAPNWTARDVELDKAWLGGWELVCYRWLFAKRERARSSLKTANTLFAREQFCIYVVGEPMTQRSPRQIMFSIFLYFFNFSNNSMLIFLANKARLTSDDNPIKIEILCSLLWSLPIKPLTEHLGIECQQLQRDLFPFLINLMSN